MRGNRKRWRASIVSTFIAGFCLAIHGQVRGQYLTIYGGPTYDSATGTGYLVTDSFASFHTPIVGSGVAAATVEKYVGGDDKGSRAVRWDASGATATELGNLGTYSPDGITESTAFDINDSGTVVGRATKYIGNSDKGSRAVRWDSSGPAATELSGLGTTNGSTNSVAYAINNSGTATGYTNSFITGDLGNRAVRWNSAGAVTELQALGMNNSGQTNARGTKINEAGAVVGTYDGFNGVVPARWGGSGTAVTTLDGAFGSGPLAINNSGIAVGEVFTGPGTDAARWDTSGTAVTQLENLGIGSGANTTEALGINDSGTAAGWSLKHVAGAIEGSRAVRWDASSTVATELGNLGTDNSGFSNSQAFGINNAGIIIGYAEKYDLLGNDLGKRAAMWGLDGVAIDLNTLIDPASGWVSLSEADDISNDNWITGIGTFDPDGPGSLPSYQRAFLIQVPEPTSMTLLAFCAAMILSRWRMNPSNNREVAKSAK